MTEEQKQAAIGLCEGNIIKLKVTIAKFEVISPELDILSNLRSELVIQEAGLDALTAPAADLAELVPDEKRDEDGNATSEFDHGWNACRAEMLRKIEEAK